MDRPATVHLLIDGMQKDPQHPDRTPTLRLACGAPPASTWSKVVDLVTCTMCKRKIFYGSAFAAAAELPAG